MSEDHGKTYQYTPLSPGEIRTLIVESPLVGGAAWSLKTVRLDDGNELSEDSRFDALSYTWGDQSRTFPLTLSCGRTLQIHHNLHEALPYLAKRRSAKPLWIDAVCINQSDSIEKLSQIRLMNQIYRSASQVWVWFGPGNNHTEEAVALLSHIAKVGEQSKELETGLLNETPESKGLPEVSSPIWPAVYDILHNRWFSRLWTVQEAALARSITCLCGDCEIEWSLLERVMDTGPYVNSLHDANRRTIQLQRHEEVFLVREGTQKRECAISESKPVMSAAFHLLWVSLMVSSSHSCFDPRDRIFGILGLVHERDIHRAGLGEDGLSITELYARFCGFLLQNVRISARNFWCLLSKASAPKKMPGLPSWCPDFYNQISDEAGFRTPERAEEQVIFSSTNAGKPGREWAEQGANPRDLVLQGIFFDTVAKLYPQFPMQAEQLNPAVGLDRVASLLAGVEAWEKTLALGVVGTAAITEAADTAFLSSRGEQKGQVSLDGYLHALLGDIRPKGFGKYIFTTPDLYKFRGACHKWIMLAKRFEELEKK